MKMESNFNFNISKEEATSILRGALKDSNIPFTVGGEKTILDGFPIIEPVQEINKSIECYMGLPYRLEITPDLDEGGFVARYPELPGCITVGDSMEEIAEYAEDAKREWLAAALDNIDRHAEVTELKNKIELK